MPAQQGQRPDIARHQLCGLCPVCYDAPSSTPGSQSAAGLHPLPMGVIMSTPTVNRDRQSKRRERDAERRKARQSKAAARRSFGGRK